MMSQRQNYDRHFAANAEDLLEFSERVDKIIEAVNDLKYNQALLEGDLRDHEQIKEVHAEETLSRRMRKSSPTRSKSPL